MTSPYGLIDPSAVLAFLGGSIQNQPAAVPLIPIVVADKKDTGKPPCDLLSPIALLEVSRVLAFGAKKYASHNWRKGLPFSKVIAAIMRHVYRRMCGEVIDPETGLSHAAAIMCEAMFLTEFEITMPDRDDTYRFTEEEMKRVRAYLDTLFPNPTTTEVKP